MNIKFRAKDERTNEWRYGVPVKSNDGLCLVTEIYHIDGSEYNVKEHTVKEETLCRLVAIRNGIEFYEHDIVEDFLSIRWNEEDASFEFYWTYSGDTTNGDINWYENDTVLKEVVGNIFDNPEMVEDGAS